MKVSVIIPVYNASKYIDRCFNSLINQKVSFEIIAINDGSTDTSLAILKKYEKKYPFIKVINQKNSGQAVARNKGIKEAKGTYLAFIDVDDFVDNNYLLELVNKIEEDNSDIVYCDYYEYYSYKKLVLKKNDSHPLFTNYAPWGKLYRKSFFIKSNLQFLEGRIFEDIVITPLLMAMGKTSYVSLPLYYYALDNESTIRKNTYDKKYEDIFDAIDETIYNFKKHRLYNKYKDELEFIYLDSFLLGGVLRFANYKEGIENISIVRNKILGYFPNILNNKYYLKLPKKQKLKYKLLLKMNPSLLSFGKRFKKKVSKCKKY